MNITTLPAGGFILSFYHGSTGKNKFFATRELLDRYWQEYLTNPAQDTENLYQKIIAAA